MLQPPLKKNTTIQLETSTLMKLGRYRDPVTHHNWSEVIDEVLEMQGEIYTDVLAVDGKLARLTDHEVILQMGQSSQAAFYFYKQGIFTKIDLPALEILGSEIHASILKSHQTMMVSS